MPELLGAMSMPRCGGSYLRASVRPVAEPHTYLVTVVAEQGGPEEEMRERLAVIAAFRLQSLDRRTGQYPVVGGWFDMLDSLEGKFLWEMSDEELERKPPVRIDFELLSVDPAERPLTPTEVRVSVRVPR